ncbi:STAS domain-containing protein [Thiolapillus sp.]
MGRVLIMSARQISLASHLDMDALPALTQALRDALAEKAPLSLDGSQVQHIDGASLQLLLAAARSAQQEGIPLDWHQPSPALSKAAATLGLNNDLALEANET